MKEKHQDQYYYALSHCYLGDAIEFVYAAENCYVTCSVNLAKLGFNLHLYHILVQIAAIQYALHLLLSISIH